jgi:hypothetical protein
MFHSNSYIILICVMCLWPGLVVDTRYVLLAIKMVPNVNHVVIAYVSIDLQQQATDLLLDVLTNSGLGTTKFLGIGLGLL